MRRTRAWNCVGVIDGGKLFLTGDLPVGKLIIILGGFAAAGPVHARVVSLTPAKDPDMRAFNCLSNLPVECSTTQPLALAWFGSL